jgi:small subunit ribosomal protein S7e
MTRILKKGEANALESQVASALDEVAASTDPGARAELDKLKITGVKDLNGDGLRVLIVAVPYKQIGAFQRVQAFLVPELEKKLSAQVIVVGKRRAFPKTPQRNRRYRAIRPVGRTLRAVQEALLQDVVYPASIVGKRIHYDLKGKQATRVILDQQDRTYAEDRLGAFAIAYGRLTGLKTKFEIATP